MKSKIVMALVAVGMMASLANAGVVSKNGIAKDSATGLMWQDDDSNIGVDWYEAKSYCKELRLGGFQDWRIPNRYELTTVIDSTKKNEPYVIDGFKAMPTSQEFIWSSDGCVHNSKKAWVLLFNGGYIADTFKQYKEFKNPIRCVRGSQINYDSLQKLNKLKKLKISKMNMDDLAPVQVVQPVQTSSSSQNSYNSWTTGYKNKRSDSYAPFSYESTEIKCSDGTNGTVFNYYGRDTSYHYIVNATNSYKSFEEAANFICGNR